MSRVLMQGVVGKGVGEDVGEGLVGIWDGAHVWIAGHPVQYAPALPPPQPDGLPPVYPTPPHPA